MDTSLLLAIIAGGLALVALVIAGIGLSRAGGARRAVSDLEARLRAVDRRARESEQTAERAASPHVAVVLNPSKHDDPQKYREYVRTAIERFEGSQATFFETTEEDPGYGQAKEAMAAGADLVIAAGGDGTVRMVASALAGTDTRMAILPAGTGNLLARNLEIPLDDIDGAIRVAALGTDTRIDVGWLRAGSSSHGVEIAEKQIFLVMAGFGADAEVIGATSSTLKRRIGWIAYVLAGADKIIGRSHDVEITLPGGVRKVVKARTVLMGNVGKLPAGIVLMPDATIDNGRLEILAMGWRSAAGLSQIAAQLVAPSLGRGRRQPRLSSMERYLVSHVRLVASKAQPVQLDGDTADAATHLLAEVDPGALRMMVPGDR